MRERQEDQQIQRRDGEANAYHSYGVEKVIPLQLLVAPWCTELRIESIQDFNFKPGNRDSQDSDSRA